MQFLATQWRYYVYCPLPGKRIIFQNRGRRRQGVTLSHQDNYKTNSECAQQKTFQKYLP